MAIFSDNIYCQFKIKKNIIIKLNKTNKVKFWLTFYSYFDVSMIMVIIIKKNKYLKKSHKKLNGNLTN